MSVSITIQGRVIEFPSSAASPNWAGPVVEFAEAVEDALSGVAGAYDVSPQVYTLSSDVNTNVDVPLLNFPTSNVRSAFIRYAIYRTSNTTVEAETGSLEIVYNSNAGTWQSCREAVGNDTKLTFNVTNAGQVQFSTTAIGGTYSTGTLTYTAQAILQSS
jgi:hypothetical protein